MRAARLVILALGACALGACHGATEPAATADDAALGPEDAGAPPDVGTANEPPAGFLDPAGSSFVTLRFKGLINSAETVFEDYANVITGIGALRASVGATGTRNWASGWAARSRSAASSIGGSSRFSSEGRLPGTIAMVVRAAGTPSSAR